MAIEFKRIEVRTGSAGEWAAANPVLADGEPGWARDVGLKVGNGTTAWLDLPYFVLATELAGYVLRSGDTMTGNLTVTHPDGWPLVAIDAEAEELAGLIFRRGGLDRWAIQIVPDPETGGNAASNLDFMRCDDDGVPLGIAARWDRATGVLDIGAGVLTATPALAADDRRVATTEWVRDHAAAAAVAKISTSAVPASTTLTASNSRAGQTNMTPGSTASIHTSDATGITVPAGVHVVTARVQWAFNSTVQRSPAIFDGTRWHMIASVANNANETDQTITAVIVTAAPTLIQWGAYVASLNSSIRSNDATTGSTLTVVTL